MTKASQPYVGLEVVNTHFEIEPHSSRRPCASCGGGSELGVSALVCRYGWGINQPVSPGERCSDTTRSADSDARPHDVG